MDKQPNQKGWLLVLPVVVVVAFSALVPLMTVVNYSVQDTFGNNQFFWNGVGWFAELLDPNSELGARFLEALWRNLCSPPSSSPSRFPSAWWWLSPCRARGGRWLSAWS